MFTYSAGKFLLEHVIKPVTFTMEDGVNFMKILKSVILLILLVLLADNILSAMGSKITDIPMKSSKIKLEDGEYIRMGNYVGGEKIGEWHFAARVHKSENRAEFYEQELNLKTGQKLPSHYTNFKTYRYTVDLNTGSLISSFYQNPSTNEKRVQSSDFRLDEERNVINFSYGIWDGNSLKTSRYKIEVRKGYPICDMSSMAYITRFLDITGPGVVYLCVPDFLKEPLPIRFSYLGREIVHTTAGDFKTIKATFVVADPFLGKLLSPYMKDLTMWIEDSPRMLFVKSCSSVMGEIVLEEVSDIHKKGLD
jgi:hypothetical protein